MIRRLWPGIHHIFFQTDACLGDCLTTTESRFMVVFLRKLTVSSAEHDMINLCFVRSRSNYSAKDFKVLTWKEIELHITLHFINFKNLEILSWHLKVLRLKVWIHIASLFVLFLCTLSTLLILVYPFSCPYIPMLSQLRVANEKQIIQYTFFCYC